ncbi:MAG: pseudouridine synthase, partial [Nanoarchaeota archaeon]
DIKKSLFSIGRLDFDTTGLLLFTNDGLLAHKLAHPKGDIEKTYVAKIRGIINRPAMAKLRRGLRVPIKFGHRVGNYKTMPAQVKLMNKGKTFSILEIVIKEGKKRQIRQMLKTVGFPVMSLQRTQIANLNLGRLESGKWRYLKEFDLSQLGFSQKV